MSTINIQCRRCKKDHAFTEEESRIFNKENPFICTQCTIEMRNNKEKLDIRTSPLKEFEPIPKISHWKKYLGFGVIGCIIALGVVSKAFFNPGVIRDLLIATPGLFIIWVLVTFTKITKRKKVKKKAKKQ